MRSGKQRCAQELRSGFPRQHGMPSGCNVEPGQIQVEKNKYKNILYAILFAYWGEIHDVSDFQCHFGTSFWEPASTLF